MNLIYSTRNTLPLRIIDHSRRNKSINRPPTMGSEIKSAKNYRPRFQIVYYWTKLNGLVPFTYSRSKSTVGKSSWSTCYSVLFAFLYVAAFLFVSSNTLIIATENKHNDKSVRIVISILETLISVLRTTLLYGMQLWFRKKIVCVINDAITLWHYILKRWPAKQFFDAFFLKHYKSRMIWLLIEIIILMISYKFNADEYRLKSESDLAYVYAVINVYNHLVSPITTGVFYYGGMMVVLQFYRILNQQVLSWMESIKTVEDRKANHSRMQFFCEISDNIDEASIFYSDITEYMGKVNRLFQFQIILTVLASFFLITSNVSALCVYGSSRNG